MRDKSHEWINLSPLCRRHKQYLNIHMNVGKFVIFCIWYTCVTHKIYFNLTVTTTWQHAVVILKVASVHVPVHLPKCKISHAWIISCYHKPQWELFSSMCFKIIFSFVTGKAHFSIEALELIGQLFPAPMHLNQTMTLIPNGTLPGKGDIHCRCMARGGIKIYPKNKYEHGSSLLLTCLRSRISTLYFVFAQPDTSKNDREWRWK